MSTILDHAARTLEPLADRYQAVARECRDTDATKAEFAEFLANRELETVEVLERYRSDAHPVALDTHVRLGIAFPYSSDDLELPEHPTVDELIELAQRTDTLLEQIGERISVYAASRQLAEILDALDEHVGGRRRHLAAALNELERYQPSPRQSHE